MEYSDLCQQNDSTLPHGAIDFDEIARNHCDAKFDLRRSHDDTVLMLFSSGTTGLPKGVEITNRGLVSSLHQMSAPKLDPISETSESEQEVVPVVIPMFHVYGLVVNLLHGLLKGSKLVIVPKFSSELFVNVLETYKPTVLYVVPPIFHMMLNSNKFKLSHFTKTKSINSAAAPLGATDIMALSEKLQGKVDIFQMYGQTEVCVTHVQSSQIDDHRKPGGIGFLLPSTEAKIMSTTTGNEVAANRVGEMYLRGPQVMKGYYKDRNANDAAFTNDGWFKTGDLCYYDEDGHFFLQTESSNSLR
uniref:AMP-dependent synthetase/ligase domain-containing protein n=1 Tax=Photinus pyralis TaxID=7054 RepID=A0A1Y1KJN8_PHOPY